MSGLDFITTTVIANGIQKIVLVANMDLVRKTQLTGSLSPCRQKKAQHVVHLGAPLENGQREFYWTEQNAPKIILCNFNDYA